MSGKAELFLGVIAVATLVTAIFQVGVLVAAGLLAMRLVRLTERIDKELKPLFRHLDAMGRDAARVTSLATTQVERADALLADFTVRVERTMDSVQAAAGIPIREGAAIMAGLRAMMGTFKNGRRARPRHRGEDEDALFI